MMSLGMVAPTVSHHHISPRRTKIGIDSGETKGLCHHGSSHLAQIVGLRVTGVLYQQLPECHPGLIGQMDPSTTDEGDGTKRMELT